MVTDRFKKLVVRRAQARLICAVAASIIAIVSINNIFPDMEVLSRFMFSLILAFVLTHIFSGISHLILHLWYYGSDAQAAMDDADAFDKEMATAAKSAEAQVSVGQVSLKVVNTPEKAYGRYMDSEIYEWLDVQDSTGKIYRCKFTGTVDMRNGPPSEIPQGCLLLWPGIMYQVDEPLNTST